MKNVKGLSTIVATLLIILLTLVAVAIIWVVVKNIIKSGADEVSMGKFAIDLEISQVKISNSTGINIAVKRNPGEAQLSGIAFITYSNDNSESFRSNFVLQPLQEREFGIVLSSFNTFSARKIAIAPILISDSGKEFIGDIEDEYTFPKVIPLVCGNRFVEGPSEECDDGDINNGDGCSENCIVEVGWTCISEPSICTLINVGGNEYIWTNELLTNPGFESFLSGWYSSANFYVTTDSPQSGTYACYSQDVSSVDSFIQQDVNLGTWQIYINSGDAVINATGYGKSMQYPNHDRTLIQVIFFNSANEILDDSQTSGYVENSAWWEGGIREYPVPVGTSYVRIKANSYDPDGSSSGSIDSFSVSVGYDD